MTPPAYPPKPAPGDRIAVISPSAGLPGLLPLPYDLGLERLRKEYGLDPVEYPATRKMGSTSRERADDIHTAFADPGIKAVIASIGGNETPRAGERSAHKQAPGAVVGNSPSVAPGAGCSHVRRGQTSMLSC